MNNADTRGCTMKALGEGPNVWVAVVMLAMAVGALRRLRADVAYTSGSKGARETSIKPSTSLVPMRLSWVNSLNLHLQRELPGIDRKLAADQPWIISLPGGFTKKIIDDKRLTTNKNLF
jgi:hypothetical protein